MLVLNAFDYVLGKLITLHVGVVGALLLVLHALLLFNYRIINGFVTGPRNICLPFDPRLICCGVVIVHGLGFVNVSKLFTVISLTRWHLRCFMVHLVLVATTSPDEGRAILVHLDFDVDISVNFVGQSSTLWYRLV